MAKNGETKAPQKEDENGKPNGSVVFHCRVGFFGGVFQTSLKLDLLRSIFERVGNPLQRKKRPSQFLGVYLCMSIKVGFHDILSTISCFIFL